VYILARILIRALISHVPSWWSWWKRTLTFFTPIKIATFLILVVVGFIFYWYEWRPSEIRKECYEVAIKRSGGRSLLFGTQAETDIRLQDNVETFYKNCLKQRGLER